MKPRVSLVVISVVMLGCVATSEHSVPRQVNEPPPRAPRQSRSVSPETLVPRQAERGMSAYEFEDADIEIPTNVNLVMPESDSKPRPGCRDGVPRVKAYFRRNDYDLVGEMQRYRDIYSGFDASWLTAKLENALTRTGRFCVETRDRASMQAEAGVQVERGGAPEARRQRAEINARWPDLLVVVDARTTAELAYFSTFGRASYRMYITAAFVDPRSETKLNTPAIDDIEIGSADLRSESDLRFVNIGGRYYTGFDYTSKANVGSLIEQMTVKAIAVLENRIENATPVTAIVTAVRGDRFSIAAGTSQGMRERQAMILALVEADGLMEPIAVLDVAPGNPASSGKAVLWKKSPIARRLRAELENGTMPSAPRRLIVVAVGAN